MAITNIAGTATSFPSTVERRADNDGSAGFWDATIVPIVDRTAYLYDQLLGATNGLAVKLASQAVGSLGTFLIGQRAVVDANQGTLAAGTLLAAITSLWTGKAGLTATNTFTGPRIRSGTAAVDVERVRLLSSSTSTYSFATAYDDVIVDMNDGNVAVNQTWTAAAAGAELNATVNVAAYGTTLLKHVTVVRDDASVICILGAAGDGFATLKFLVDATYPAGRWRLTSGSGTITITTPW